ncbi:MAG: hypothetical protein JW820_10355 [Spirochaetales bacterium]|nr:hypothetical protein [Spirochaetales bacterium]
MKRALLPLLAVLLVLAAAFPAASAGIDSLTLRLNAGAGYTVIDLPTAFDWDPDYLDDWDYTDIKVNLQGLFLQFGGFRLGAEIGYNRLYYYYFVVPNPPFSPNHYYGSVGPVSLSALGAFEVIRNLFVQLSAGLYIFGDGVTAGLSSSVMYAIPIAASMAIPVAAYFDVVFGDGMPIAFGLTAGFQYRFDFAR